MVAFMEDVLLPLVIGIISTAVGTILFIPMTSLWNLITERCHLTREPLPPQITAVDESTNQPLAAGNASVPDEEMGSMNAGEGDIARDLASAS